MKRLVCLLIGFASLASIASSQEQKKRVAIMNFDYATVRSSSAALFGTDLDIGKGIADLMVEKLVQSGVYSVIERKALDKVLAEQNFSNSDRADTATGAKLGKILGVDAIILGSITQFGRDDKNTAVGGGALGGIGRKYGIGGVDRKSSKAVVAISARMINTETGEIMAVANGRGESSRSGTGLLGSGGTVWGGGGGGSIDMSSHNFAETLIGEAVNGAIGPLVQRLNAEAPRIVATTFKKVTVEGMVADVSSSGLILNIGTKAGVKVGDRLEVRRKVRTITDPATHKVLRSIEDKIGEVVIAEADDVSASGTFAGSSAAKVGDTVRSMP